jgi:hypothetical protein
MTMTLNHGAKITASDMRTFELMYRGGETYAMIAAALGRSVKSVESIRRKMDLPARDNPALAQKAKREAALDPTRRMRKDFERSAGPTLQENNREFYAKRNVQYHLIDLMREYGGKTLGEAKANYQRRNELDIPPGSERSLIIPSPMTLSACSSSAGWMS